MIISKLQGITPALPGGAPGPLEDQLHLARLYSRPHRDVVRDVGSDVGRSNFCCAEYHGIHMGLSENNVPSNFDGSSSFPSPNYQFLGSPIFRQIHM